METAFIERIKWNWQKPKKEKNGITHLLHRDRLEIVPILLIGFFLQARSKILRNFRSRILCVSVYVLCSYCEVYVTYECVCVCSSSTCYHQWCIVTDPCAHTHQRIQGRNIQRTASFVNGSRCFSFAGNVQPSDVCVNKRSGKNEDIKIR